MGYQVTTCPLVAKEVHSSFESADSWHLNHEVVSLLIPSPPRPPGRSSLHPSIVLWAPCIQVNSLHQASATQKHYHSSSQIHSIKEVRKTLHCLLCMNFNEMKMTASRNLNIRRPRPTTIPDPQGTLVTQNNNNFRNDNDMKKSPLL